ncbi:MAG: ribonuclease III [Parvibaculaceae bacterium]
MSGRSQEALRALCERIGHTFKDLDLLDRALTHASHLTTGRKDYERLEFLGDRVLGLVAAEELYNRFPRSSEGMLARRFVVLVRQDACAEVARELGLPDYIRKGQRAGGLANNPRVLGDACEALIAAVYLDGGLEAARGFILRYWQPFFERAAKIDKDPKTALQEWALGAGLPLPAYIEETRSGPDHAPIFVMSVEVEGLEAATGEGPTKRSAEQNAAEAFLARQGIWR